MTNFDGQRFSALASAAVYRFMPDSIFLALANVIVYPFNGKLQQKALQLSTSHI